MNWRSEWKRLAYVVGAFAVCYWLPAGRPRFDSAVNESLLLVRWYARQHVLLCLVPAFLIAGGIATFVSGCCVMQYLGGRANRAVAYGVASVSGTVLAVCSCTVLPLFAGIYRMGAGLGPATAFLYSGPAINVLAIILTARVLGLELGVARAVGAASFGVIIGLLMQRIYRGEDRPGASAQVAAEATRSDRPLWQTASALAAMVAILVFANWGRPSSGDAPVGAGAALYALIHGARFYIAGAFAVIVAVMLAWWFTRSELAEWAGASWDSARRILPLLLLGVLAAGLLLGRPAEASGREGLIPQSWVGRAVGGNSLRANACASIMGAFMYFATLTEVPILQGLLAAGMGKGPALALLLAGPALSLPSMLVIRSVLGTAKTIVYVVLVVVMATISGSIFGALF